jgi:hypothetical protein
MAVEVLTDVTVTINSVALSAFARRVTINFGANALNHIAFGVDTERSIAGLKKWDMTVEFENDYVAASVDVTLFGLVGAAAFTIAIRKSSAAKSASNPEYTGSCILEGFAPMDVEVGNISMTSAHFLSAGALSRAIV